MSVGPLPGDADTSTPDDTAREHAFTLGVNYWPRRKAMVWWADFDRHEVADEFDVIAELGLDVVRIFALWEHFQPDPTRVDMAAMRHLEAVCDLAADRELGLDVTFFTGHMSGPNWVPRWLLHDTDTVPSPAVRQVVSEGRVVGRGYRNPFTDPEALAAGELLVGTVVGAFADHPAPWMWNLGNEPDLLAHPPPGAGRRWAVSLRDIIRRLDPDRPVTVGLHAESLIDDNGLRVDEIFAEVDVAVMHGYPMYSSVAEGPLDPWFVPFLCALTSALCDKPVLAEEWGGPTNPDGDESTTWRWTSYGTRREQHMAGESAMAAYVAAVLPNLVATGATGAMLWCFADYAEELWDRPPLEAGGARHERHFGLVRPDGSLKPHALEVAKFAAGKPTVVTPTIAPVFADLDPDEYYRNPQRTFADLYARWRDAVSE